MQEYASVAGSGFSRQVQISRLCRDFCYRSWSLLVSAGARCLWRRFWWLCLRIQKFRSWRTWLALVPWEPDLRAGLCLSLIGSAALIPSPALLSLALARPSSGVIGWWRAGEHSVKPLAFDRSPARWAYSRAGSVPGRRSSGCDNAGNLRRPTARP